jgi:NADPH:quinone reductase
MGKVRRAIVTKRYGGPEVLVLEERSAPEPQPGQIVIEVKAFGLNHAEIYLRRGTWGEVAEISGIECVGVVKDDPEGHLLPAQKVAALVGGMGRSLNGSYAEFTSVPSTNVVPVQTDLPWAELVLSDVNPRNIAWGGPNALSLSSTQMARPEGYSFR